MAFELVPEQSTFSSAESPESSTSDIDRLLSEILNDPNVFSLIDSPSSSSSSAPSPHPSPPCYSPSAQQLEQEALASLGQQLSQHQQHQYPQQTYAASPVESSFSLQYHTPETPSPTTPSSATDDHQAFFPASSLPPTQHPALPTPPHSSHPHSLHLHSAHPHSHPTSLPLRQTTLQVAPNRHMTQSQSLLVNCEVVISTSVHDAYLRGQHGTITSLRQGIARVLVLSLSQECQVPSNCINLVTPLVGDLIRVIHGPLQGMMGWMFNCLGEISHVRLCSGHYMQVATKNIAKLAVDSTTPDDSCCDSPLPSPLPSPTSPSLATSTCMSPLLSPALLQNGGFSNLTARSPYLPSSNASYADSLTNSVHTPANSSHMRCHRQSRLPGYNTVCNGTSRSGRHGQQLSEQHRRQQQLAYLQMQNRRGSSRGSSMRQRFQQLMQAARVNGTKTHGKNQQLEQEQILLQSCVDKPTEEILESVKGRQMSEYDFGSTGDGGEVSSSCIQVPLICPLSQSRLTLPCRGVQCKHAQCFDAEAFIEFNKCVVRPKENGGTGYAYQSIKQQLFKCPLCSKHTPFSHLYIDRIMLQILQETDQDEVEFDKTGSWKPVEKKSLDDDVIDLTLDNDDGDS